MRTTVKYLVLLLITLCSVTAMAQKLILGSFNLRFDNAADTGNLWKDRAPVVASLIRFHNFDILGTQEGLKNQLDDICAALPGYSRYGVGRDNGVDAGEHSAIFYKTDRFTLLGSGDFWLSETPEKPSLGWDATCCKRICSWVHLRDKQSRKDLWCFNAHYDHQGIIAREESSKLILRKIREIAGDGRTIFTGDLNGGHTCSWYQQIETSGWLTDSYDHVAFPYTNNPSFQAFGKKLSGTEIIDHIFTTKEFKALRWGILSDSYRGHYPSDHFPVLAEVEY